MKNTYSVIARACSWLTEQTRAWTVGIAVIWTVTAPGSLWGQSAVWLPQGATSGNIYYTGGKIGIGTANPTTKLTISGEFWDGGLWLNGGDGGTAAPIAIHSAKDYHWTANSIFSDATHSNAFVLQARWSDGAHNLLLQPAIGNVGIGTTNPQYKLAVEGAIGARDIIVTNAPWSDYVFRPDYKLRPLREVSAFIQKHRHLPDIPSEAEVKEKGVSVADMQAKLLAKVEELTLHLIQQDKTNRDMRPDERAGKRESGTP